MKRVISLLLCIVLISGCGKNPVDTNKAGTTTPVVNVQPTPVEVKNSINVPMHVDTLTLGDNSITSSVKLGAVSLSLMALTYVARNVPWGAETWEHARCIILASLSFLGFLASTANLIDVKIS